MTPSATAVLGVPVDNLTMDTAVEEILNMIPAYHRDHRPRYVATVNVDFMTTILSWRGTVPRHPELLHILRKADMVTADGMPIVWAARWLGAPLPMRVAGSDLVPRLAEAAAANGNSLYFLGGKRFEMTAYRAARVLKERLPGLSIAGIDAPWVHTRGEALAQAEEEDLKIVEKINAAGPDILLVAFGSPKQEIWFDRNRHRLKVPVAMGVGATFEFISGAVHRAPPWMRKAGLEWAFRLRQEPRRMWKRYLVDFVKFSMLIWPSVLHCRIRGSASPVGPRRLADTPRAGVKPAGVRRVALPATLSAPLPPDTIQAFSQPSPLVVDFSQVRHVSAGGLGNLARLWQKADAAGTLLDITGTCRHHHKWLAVHRLADYFRGTDPPPFSYTATYPAPDTALLRFSGILDTRQIAAFSTPAFLDAIGGRDCIVDMQRLLYIGSSGLMLMLNLSRDILAGGRSFVICSPRADVWRMFHMADLGRLFVIRPTADAAMDFIHTVRGDAQATPRKTAAFSK